MVYLLVQLCACRDARINHQKVELFFFAFLVNGADQHAAGIDAHHLSGRQIRDGDTGLADEQVLSGAIRGAGESFIPMLITLLTTCAPRIIWITLAVPQSKNIIHILRCYPLSWAVTAIVFIIYYQFYKRRVLAMEF